MSIRHEKLPVAVLEKIDDLCAEFESGWQRGERPEIEAVVAEVNEPRERAALLAELLVLDWDYRRRLGETPKIEEYNARFPHDDGIVERALNETGEATKSSRLFEPPSIEHVAKLFPSLEILELIGAGGMGAVYKARQKGLDRLVAVKILPDEVGRDVKFALRFTREARALAKMNHPNIVSVFEFGSAEGTYFFLMEFVDGSTLREVIEGHELNPEQALSIVPSLCDALQYAHDQGVVHRDIKPENILLNKQGQVKIADFGLSRLLGNESTEERLTGTHQVMGTLRYMAPEQMEGTHRVDHRADIYSLGVVIYEMLTGELPIGRFAVPSRKAHIDIRLDEVVLRTLEKEPQRRYQHASDIKSDVVSITSSTANANGVASAKGDVSPSGIASPSTGEASKLANLEKQELAGRVLVLRRQLMSRVKNSLKPLFWGQIVQMLFGIVFIGIGVACWAPNQDVPHRLVSGIVMHVYGVLMIISAGITCGKIRRLDYTLPVDEVRGQLDQIRRHYLRAGSCIGFAWWLLWIPLCVAIRLDVVMYPTVLWPSIVIGVIGIAASAACYRWILREGTPRAEKYSASLAGESLRDAYVALNEIQASELI